MTSRQKGNGVALKGNEAMTADYGQRAATALNQLLPGPHQDKAVARLFGVSVRFARYLRTGQHWTSDRLSQASAMLGVAFDAALYSPVTSAQHFSEMAEIAGRLARLEARLEEMDRGGDAGSAPAQGARIDEARRADDRHSGGYPAEGRDYPLAREKGRALAGPLRAVGAVKR